MDLKMTRYTLLHKGKRKRKIKHNLVNIFYPLQGDQPKGCGRMTYQRV